MHNPFVITVSLTQRGKSLIGMERGRNSQSRQLILWLSWTSVLCSITPEMWLKILNLPLQKYSKKCEHGRPNIHEHDMEILRRGRDFLWRPNFEHSAKFYYSQGSLLDNLPPYSSKCRFHIVPMPAKLKIAWSPLKRSKRNSKLKGVVTWG